MLRETMTTTINNGSIRSDSSSISIGNKSSGQHAFVTMVTSDSYVAGALVLAHSLREAGTTYPIECIVTSNVSQESIGIMRKTFSGVHVVEKLDSASTENLRLLGRPELGSTVTKIQLWTLEHLEKAVYLDADMLVLRNIDDLFEREEFSASPDIGWPDCFNSGLFVFRPSRATFSNLLQHLQVHGTFDGGDQGLLNSYFSDWSRSEPSKRIPFMYNMLLNATYNYVPAYVHFKDQIRAVHFIGANKPWRVRDGKFVTQSDVHSSHLEYYQKWWHLHDKYVLDEWINQPLFMRLYNCGGTNQSFSHSHYHCYQSRPLAFDFKNYRIQWDPRVEEYVSMLKQAKIAKRVVGLPDDEMDGDEDDDIYYDYDEGEDDDTTLSLSHLSLKATAPILSQFKN